MLDNHGFEIKRKTIFVNEPFLYKGITLYQTDWNAIGLRIKLNNQQYQLPLVSLTKAKNLSFRLKKLKKSLLSKSA